MTNTIERIAQPINEQMAVNLGNFAFRAKLEAERLASFDELKVPGLEIEESIDRDQAHDNYRYTFEV